MGPRQVGKTTLVGQVLDSLGHPHTYISADAQPAEGSSWVEQQWEAARAGFKTSGAQSYILAIDEIQKVHNWSEVIKGASKNSFREAR